MKSKISIWDCRRAIDIKGGLPLTMRGDLFDVDRPSAASVARCEAARHTTRSQTGSMDRRKYSFYTLRAGTPHQAGARHHCGQRPLICLATIGPRRRGLGSQTHAHKPLPRLSAARQRPSRAGVEPLPCQPARDRRNAANCLFSTGLCESGEFSSIIRVTSPARFFDHSGHPLKPPGAAPCRRSTGGLMKHPPRARQQEKGTSNPPRARPRAGPPEKSTANRPREGQQ